MTLFTRNIVAEAHSNLGGGNSDISNSVSDMLNAIRIVAAFLVLVGHGFSFFQISIFKNETYFPYLQSLAVLVFFILSGFLTENTFAKKEPKYEYKEFVISRGKRIYEYYLWALFIVIIIDRIIIAVNPNAYLHYETLTFGNFIKNIMMIPRTLSLDIFRNRSLNIPNIRWLITNDTLGSGRPFWTLFIEWWMYIFYGYYDLVYKRKHQKNVNALDMFVAFAAVLLFIHLDFNGQCCVLCFFGGKIVNRTYRKVKIVKGMLFILFSALALLFVIVSQSVRKAYCLEECLLLNLMLLLLMVWRKEDKRKSSNLLLKEIAGITYPLYLIHYSIMELVICLPSNWMPQKLFFITIAISIGCATFFYYYVIFNKNILKRISKWKK